MFTSNFKTVALVALLAAASVADSLSSDADSQAADLLQTEADLQTAHSSQLETEVPAAARHAGFVETSVDLQTAQSGYYDHYPGYNHVDGRDSHYNRFGDKYQKNLGYRNNLGHNSGGLHYGKKSGSYGNENDLDYFRKGGAFNKGLDYHKQHKGALSAGDVGSKGHHFGSKGHLNKGHKDKGYKNVQHKEEYGYSKVFGNDEGKKLYHSAHEDKDGYHNYKKHGGYGGNKYLNDHRLNKYGAKGADEYGRYHDDYNTASGAYGTAGKYGHKNSFGNQRDHGYGNHGYSRHQPHSGWRGYNGHVHTPVYDGHLHGFNGHHHGSLFRDGYGRPSTGYGSHHRHGYGSGLGFRGHHGHDGLGYGHGRPFSYRHGY